jgi:hypothetical protein
VLDPGVRQQVRVRPGRLFYRKYTFLVFYFIIWKGEAMVIPKETWLVYFL